MGDRRGYQPQPENEETPTRGTGEQTSVVGVPRPFVLASLAFGLAGIVGGLWAGYSFATQPAFSEVSLCWSFRPWPWRSINMLLASIGGLVGAVVGVGLSYLASLVGPKLAEWTS